MRRLVLLCICICITLLCTPAGAEFVFSSQGNTPAATQPPSDNIQPPQIITEPDVIGTPQIITEPDVIGTQPQTAPVEILISAAGDVTLGGNMRGNPSTNMYTKIIDRIDGDLSYFFANVYDIFSQDDLTLVNFEGTLTTATDYLDNTFCFRAPQEHILILPLGSIEAVAFENNHVRDFKQKGYDDTIAMFEQQGIVYSTEAHMGVYETKGVSIAMLAYQTFGNAYARLLEQMPLDVAAARAEHDIVIVSYHWGEEKDYKPHDRQINLGRATIDAGADLVLGHHSHRVNPIELYNGKYIVYSLGNCSFSGNTRPDDMDTFLFQQKFLVQNGAVSSGGFRIIPCSISSNSGASGAENAENDLAVTPFAVGSAAQQRVIDKLVKNGASLEYAVADYPTEWQ